MCTILIHTTVGLIGVILTVIVSIADVSWVGADAGATLKLPRPAFKLSCHEKTKQNTVYQDHKDQN